MSCPKLACLKGACPAGAGSSAPSCHPSAALKISHLALTLHGKEQHNNFLG